MRVNLHSKDSREEGRIRSERKKEEGRNGTKMPLKRKK